MTAPRKTETETETEAKTETEERRPASPWRPPTRRAFVAALGAAAAALAIRNRGVISSGDDDRPPSRWTGTTRWIGHC